MEAGGPEVLAWNELPDPVAGPGEILVRLEAAGVNFIDTYQRSGVYPMDFPHIPGSEGAGIVQAVGEGVTRYAPGDRVAWGQTSRSYAELVVVPEDAALAVPEGIDGRTAAAVPLQGMTAHYLVRSSFDVGPDTTLLITGGAGGVGRLVIQLARSLGATVIATVGSAQKAEVAREAGAQHVLVLGEMDNLDTDIPAAVRAIVPEGVDVSYDGIGKDTFEGTLASIRPRGLQVLFGGASGQVPPFDLQRLNRMGSLFITRPSLSWHVATREELEWRGGEIFQAVLDGSLKLQIGLEVPLAEAAEAHRALEGRGTTGKVVLTA